jgi:hypothetical protein
VKRCNEGVFDFSFEKSAKKIKNLSRYPKQDLDHIISAIRYQYAKLGTTKGGGYCGILKSGFWDKPSSTVLSME